MKFKKFSIYAIFLSPLLVILYYWWLNSGFTFQSRLGTILISTGRLAGLWGTYFILIQFVLRARIQPVEKIIGFMQMDRLHKKNGYLAIIFLILHPIFLVIGYSVSSGKSILDQFIQFVALYDKVLDALIGLILFVTVVVTSVYIVRKKMQYHWWYWVHLATYLAIFLAFGHQLINGEDFVTNPNFAYFWYALYAFVFGSLLYWKIIRVIVMYLKHHFYIDQVVQETYDTTSLYIKGCGIDKIKYEAGQFAFIRIMNKQLWWDVHPFSISCAPNGEYIRFTIKSVGDYTKQISRVTTGTRVIMDISHGEFTLKQAKSNKLLFIAGGVGITPLKAMIEATDKYKSNVLIFANKTENDIILRSELDKLVSDQRLKVHHVMSSDPNFSGLKGFVTVSLIEQTVPDFKERDIFVCGPPVMMNLLIPALREAGISQEQIHSEEFSL